MMIKNKTTWRKIKLGEVFDLKYGFSLPEKKRVSGDIPVYGSSGIVGMNNEGVVGRPGIIVGRKGNVGSIYYSNKPFCPIDTVYYIDSLKIPGDIKFYYYFLQRIPFKKIGSDVGVPGLNRDIAYGLDITIPAEKEYQQRIASILSAFDYKIELNNKISKNLEQTAQIIFKEWFVNFKFPGYEKVKMIDSELGKIPEGWGVKSWGDLEGVSVAGDWGEGISSDVCAESVYILRGTDILALKAGSKGECPIRYLAKESLQKRKLKPGDIVVEISGGSKNQPTGRSLYITEDILKRFELPLVCTSFCRLVRSNSMLSSILMFLHLDRLYKTKKIWNYQLQSTGISNFQYGQFREYEKLIVPPPEIQEIISNVLISCIQYSHRNENQKLAVLRDLLLPKLMSGEIRV